MEKNIHEWLDKTTKGLLDAIAAFSQEQFNQIPFAGSWTGGQVAEHIYKSESGLPVIWEGKTSPTDRAVDVHVPIIKSIFLDFSTKMQSPEFILPSDSVKQKDEMYEALKANRTEIKRLSESIDLTQTFTDFAFPQLGELTGIEWMVFICAHSQRHTHQLNKIYEHVK